MRIFLAQTIGCVGSCRVWLVNMSTRGAAWSEQEIKAIWSEKKIQNELKGSMRTKDVYKKIAKEIDDGGYSRDWEQCKAKIKNLKTDYRSAKDNNGKTGGGRKTFKFFKEMDEVLGHRPASKPAVLLDTSAPLDLSEERGEEESDKQESSDHEDGKQKQT